MKKNCLKHILYILLIIFIAPVVSNAQNGYKVSILSEYTHGKNIRHEVYSAISTSEGYVFAIGSVSSEDNEDNVLLVKLDKSGKILFSKNYPRKGNQTPVFISDIGNGELVIIGNQEQGANRSFFIQKFNTAGKDIFFKQYSNRNAIVQAATVIKSNEGDGYIAGLTIIPIQPTSKPSNILLINFDNQGNEIWKKDFGGSENEEISDIVATGDGYLTAGSSDSQGTKGRWDFWVLKCDNKGNKIWSKHYGGGDTDKAHCIIATKDKHYILAGYTYSYGEGSLDGWLLKIDGSGKQIWTQTVGDISIDEITHIAPAGDGKYVATGYTDVWILDEEGNNLSEDSNDILFTVFEDSGKILHHGHFGGMGNQQSTFIKMIEKDVYMSIANVQNNSLDILITTFK